MSDKKGFDCEKVLPYEQEGGKKEQIIRMFDTISANYDPMNRFMTFGMDIIWRKRALLALKKYKPQLMLDVATGTGDFAIGAYQLLKPQKITGIDISEGMLDVGRKKIEQYSLQKQIELQTGDSMNLNFEDQTFDAVTVAFGVRNYEDLQKGISEMCRVLKTGGHLVILEMSEPQRFPTKQLYHLYSKFVIPAFARLFSKDNKAYSYLPKSIEAFPQGEEMKALLLSCGFSEVMHKVYCPGVCAFYLATK